MADQDDPYRGRDARQWWLVFALMLTASVAVVDRSILSLLVDPIKRDLHFSDTQLGLVFGLAFAIANVLFTLPAGYLADRTSRRAIIGVGCVVWSAATALCGLVGSFGQLVAARAGVGFAESVIHPCSFSMLRAALSPERRGRGFTIYGTAVMLGTAAGYVSGSLLLKWFTSGGGASLPLIAGLSPWRQTLIALGALGLPFALLMLAVREPARPQAVAGALEAGFDSALAHVRKYWRVYLPLFAYTALAAMKANAHGAFSASVAQRRWGVPTADVGRTLGTLQAFCAPVGMWLMGVAIDRLRQRFGVRGAMLVGVVTAALGCAFAGSAPVAPSLTWFYALLAADFVIGGGHLPIAAAVIAGITPAANMGKTTAMQLVVYGLIGMGAGPAVTGWVSDTFFPGGAGIATSLALCSAAFTLGAVACAGLVLRTVGRVPQTA